MMHVGRGGVAELQVIAQALTQSTHDYKITIVFLGLSLGSTIRDFAMHACLFKLRYMCRLV